jgi:hypothetical protein
LLLRSFLDPRFDVFWDSAFFADVDPRASNVGHIAPEAERKGRCLTTGRGGAQLAYRRDDVEVY